MAGRKDIEAGRASILLTLKNQLAKGLQVAQEQLKSFARGANQLGGAFQRVGLTLLAPFLAAFRQSEKVREKMDEIAKVIGDSLAPAIMPVLDSVLEIAKRVGAWARANPDIVRNVLKIGVGLLIAAAALKAAAAVATVLATMLGIAGAIVSSPILSVVAALGAATVAWMTFTQRGRESARAIGSSLRESLKPLMDIAGSALGAALAGQFAAAGKVLEAAIHLAFLGAAHKLFATIAGMWEAIGLPNAIVAQIKIIAQALEVALGLAAGDLAGAMANARGRGGAGFDSPSKLGPLSSGTAGGAYALTFGGQGQNLQAKSYAELRAMKRHLYELVMAARRAAFARARPGMFGP